MPHTERPGLQQLQERAPRQISGCARRNSPGLTFAAAARHAIHAATIHAATRLATGTRLTAGTTAGIAARTRVGEAESRLQRIGLARTALRRAAFTTAGRPWPWPAARGGRPWPCGAPSNDADERGWPPWNGPCGWPRPGPRASPGRPVPPGRPWPCGRANWPCWLATARRDRERIGVAVAHIDAVAIRLVIAVLATLRASRPLAAPAARGSPDAGIFFSMP